MTRLIAINFATFYEIFTELSGLDAIMSIEGVRL